MDIFKKAKAIFDEVIIGVGINPDKDAIENDNRLFKLKATLPKTYVRQFNGLLTDFVAELEEKFDADVIIIKGLRNGDDLNYEEAQLRYMEDFTENKVKVIFILGDSKYSHISSSAIKKIALINPKLVEQYLP